MALGKSISPGSIYEGGDVYFDCLVVASPLPTKILWLQDVSLLKLFHFLTRSYLLTVCLGLSDAERETLKQGEGWDLHSAFSLFKSESLR